MRTFSMKRFVVTAVIFGLFGIFLFLYLTFRSTPAPAVSPITKTVTLSPVHTVIGRSVQGRSIDAYAYGTGKDMLVFVGGIHGGYEWNSAVVAYDSIDYLNADPQAVPDNLTVVVIPSLNPDGIFKIIGKEGKFSASDVPAGASTAPGRFNANSVDLNRNFDCKWQPESTWQNKTESAGSAPFSEPEAAALKDFMLAHRPVAVVFWHSQADGVYASQCQNGILPGTLNLLDAYSKGSGYPVYKTFDAYATTGGADDWLASVGIPAVSVELKTHDTVEWERNLAGIKALFSYYGQ